MSFNLHLTQYSSPLKSNVTSVPSWSHSSSSRSISLKCSLIYAWSSSTESTDSGTSIDPDCLACRYFITQIFFIQIPPKIEHLSWLITQIAVIGIQYQSHPDYPFLSHITIARNLLFYGQPSSTKRGTYYYLSPLSIKQDHIVVTGCADEHASIASELII